MLRCGIPQGAIGSRRQPTDADEGILFQRIFGDGAVDGDATEFLVAVDEPERAARSRDDKTGRRGLRKRELGDVACRVNPAYTGLICKPDIAIWSGGDTADHDVSGKREELDVGPGLLAGGVIASEKEPPGADDDDDKGDDKRSN